MVAFVLLFAFVSPGSNDETIYKRGIIRIEHDTGATCAELLDQIRSSPRVLWAHCGPEIEA